MRNKHAHIQVLMNKMCIPAGKMHDDLCLSANLAQFLSDLSAAFNFLSLNEMFG